MSSKTIAFKSPVPFTKPAEDWVGATEITKQVVPAVPSGPTKRLTVDIPEDLHRRIKVDCAQKGAQISDIVREILVKSFPEA